MKSEKVTYIVVVAVDVGESVDSVRSLLKGINAGLATSGVEGKIRVEQKFSFSMTSNRELTTQEKLAMKTRYYEEANHKARILSIRRKSRQSRSQSESR